MEKQENTKVVIIGGGLTGLSLACFLRRKKVPFLLLEKGGEPGGVIRTFREKGFVFEGGPNTGVVGNLDVKELFDCLHPLCEIEIANSEAKRRLIWKNDRWYPIPSGLKEGVTTPLFNFQDKIRLLWEPFRPKGINPMETISQLVVRRMGRSFLDYAVDPFISGIYAGDPDRLVTRYALPKLYRLEQDYGSFIGGALKKKSREKGPRPSREVFSVKGGLNRLIHALVDIQESQNIILNAHDCHVLPDEGGYSISYRKDGILKTVRTQHVVSAAGGGALRQLMPFLPEEELAMIENLEYAPVIQVVLGFSKWLGNPLNAFGGLVPSSENRRILGVLFPSAFLSGRAPEGGALLSVFMGGIRKREMIHLSDSQVMGIVQDEIQQMMKLPHWNPDLVKIYRYPAAIPQYTADSLERLKAIVRIQMKYSGLYLAGNIQEGIGMADRIAQSKRIADLLSESCPGLDNGREFGLR